MKVIKKILMGFGVVFLIFVALAIFIAGSSSEFKNKHQTFVKDYTAEFSKTWKIESVSEKSTNGLLSNINTPNGQRAIGVFRSLGKLVEITDIELNNYSANAGGPTVGIFKFKAAFENGKTVVTVTIHEIDGVVKVHGFYIDPIGNISEPKEASA